MQTNDAFVVFQRLILSQASALLLGEVEDATAKFVVDGLIHGIANGFGVGRVKEMPKMRLEKLRRVAMEQIGHLEVDTFFNEVRKIWARMNGTHQGSQKPATMFDSGLANDER